MHRSRQCKGAIVYGEIEFVVLNEAGDARLIEQKNGTLEERENGLHKQYGEVRKSVADQILRAVANVKEKFGYQLGAGARLKAECLIYCPDHALKSLNAAAIDLERVFELDDCGSGLDRRRGRCRPSHP